MHARARLSGAQPPSRSRLRRLTAAVLAAGGLAGALPQPGLAASQENFQVSTTAGLLALCDTAPGQDNYVAAIHFCEGFTSGAYQYYLALAAHDPKERYVCLPDPAPSRDKIKADFVAWTKTNASALKDPPVESIFRYLGQVYPCAQAKK
jgi:Rap1a immunity proteins